VIEASSKIAVFVAHLMNIGDMLSYVMVQASSFTEPALGLSFVVTFINFQSIKTYGWLLNSTFNTLHDILTKTTLLTPIPLLVHHCVPLTSSLTMKLHPKQALAGTTSWKVEYPKNGQSYGPKPWAIK
jgi:hypothetical protein